tara:strand:+ start:2259 stop:3461 length:1203 start_codon:yes stop_codon:yes gene_type:complete
MARLTFDDLVLIYRNTQFDGHGGGVLTIADDEIAALLRAIEADERLYDDAQLSLVDAADPIVGTDVKINISSPKLSLGILASNFDSLFQSPKATFTEPTNYYVIDEGYAIGDQPLPEILTRYRALLSAVSILRDAASYADDVQRELVFIGTEKVILPIHFHSSDLSASLEEQAGRLIRIFNDPLHGDEKAQLLSATVMEIASSQRLRRRFIYLIENLDRVCDEVEKGYKLFASSFSYSKIRNDVEAARLDYINKIHKTIVDIQGQLLGIPIATIVVASQLKPSTNCDATFWANSAVLLGAWIFVVLLTLAVMNQWHTLATLSDAINNQRTRLLDDYAAVSNQFSDVFVSLQKRIRWHRKVLGCVVLCAFFGALLASFAYVVLTKSGMGTCDYLVMANWHN